MEHGDRRGWTQDKARARGDKVKIAAELGRSSPRAAGGKEKRMLLGVAVKVELWGERGKAEGSDKMSAMGGHLVT